MVLRSLQIHLPLLVIIYNLIINIEIDFTLDPYANLNELFENFTFYLKSKRSSRFSYQGSSFS